MSHIPNAQSPCFSELSRADRIALKLEEKRRKRALRRQMPEEGEPVQDQPSGVWSGKTEPRGPTLTLKAAPVLSQVNGPVSGPLVSNLPNPRPPLTKFFQVVYFGEIDSVSALGRGPVDLSYGTHFGEHWRLNEGQSFGTSQTAYAAHTSWLKRLSGSPSEVVFNYPFGLLLASSSPYGWPRFVFSIFGTSWGKRVLKGCGSVVLPLESGRKEIEVPLYKPKNTVFYDSQVYFIDPLVIATGEGREHLEVVSQGSLKLTINTHLTGFSNFLQAQ